MTDYPNPLPDTKLEIGNTTFAYIESATDFNRVLKHIEPEYQEGSSWHYPLEHRRDYGSFTTAGIYSFRFYADDPIHHGFFIDRMDGDVVRGFVTAFTAMLEAES